MSRSRLTPEQQEQVREVVVERATFAITIVMDGIVVLVAIGVRSVLLHAFVNWIPSGTGSWALTLLEHIVDLGIVLGAGVLVVFDIMKRILISARSVKREYHRGRD